MGHALATASFGSGGWTPAALPGLVMWWDPFSIVQSGGKSSQWTDRSGSGNHGVQATGAVQPAYVASGINGLPSLQTVIATSQYMGIAGGKAGTSIMGAGTQGERWLVGKNQATASANGFEFGWGSAAGVGDLLGFTDGNIYDGFGVTTRQSYACPGGIATLGSPFCYGTSVSGGVQSIYLNKFSAASASTGSLTAGWNASAINILGVNALSSFSSYLWSEWVVTNVALSAAQRKNLVQYFSRRYGITVS